MKHPNDPEEPSSFGRMPTAQKPQSPSLSGPTDLIQLTPDFVEALNRVAAKKKTPRSKLWYVALAALLVGAVVLAVSSSARGYVAAKGRAVVARITGHAPETAASSAASAAQSALPPVSATVQPTSATATEAMTARPPATTIELPDTSATPSASVSAKPKATLKKPPRR